MGRPNHRFADPPVQRSTAIATSATTVALILPEFAELDGFIELFDNERSTAAG
jgi:hypothetical protein